MVESTAALSQHGVNILLGLHFGLRLCILTGPPPPPPVCCSLPCMAFVLWCHLFTLQIWCSVLTLEASPQNLSLTKCLCAHVHLALWFCSAFVSCSLYSAMFCESFCDRVISCMPLCHSCTVAAQQHGFLLPVFQAANGALQWGEEGVDIKDKHYRLVRLHFMDKSPPQTDSPSPNAEGMGDTAHALLNGAL